MRDYNANQVVSLKFQPSSGPINQTDFGLVEGNLLELAQSLETSGPADKGSEVRLLAQRLHSFNTRLIEETELQVKYLLVPCLSGQPQ